MTSPLRISTDESPEITSLKTQLAQAKVNLGDPSDEFYSIQLGHMNDLQSQLDALTNPSTLGPNIAGPTGKAPTFSGPRIDSPANIGVDALKLIAYPGGAK